MTFRLELASIYNAIRKKEAILVDMLLFEGVRFKTQRNEEADLNLWEALDLPDSDVNVSTIVQNANRHGARGQQDEWKGRAKARINPLPPIATEATRKAA